LLAKGEKMKKPADAVAAAEALGKSNAKGIMEIIPYGLRKGL